MEWVGHFGRGLTTLYFGDENNHHSYNPRKLTDGTGSCLTPRKSRFKWDIYYIPDKNTHYIYEVYIWVFFKGPPIWRALFPAFSLWVKVTYPHIVGLLARKIGVGPGARWPWPSWPKIVDHDSELCAWLGRAKEVWKKRWSWLSWLGVQMIEMCFLLVFWTWIDVKVSIYLLSWWLTYRKLHIQAYTSNVMCIYIYIYLDMYMYPCCKWVESKTGFSTKSQGRQLNNGHSDSRCKQKQACGECSWFTSLSFLFREYS